MSRGRVTAAQEHYTQFLSDPRVADQTSRELYGMSARDAEMSLQCMSALAQGNMPSGAALKWAQAEAAKNYGWDKGRVNSELQRCLEPSSEIARIGRYLAAGNEGRPVDPTAFKHVVDLVQTYQRESLGAEVEARMAKSQSNLAAQDRFDKMPASENAKRDADGRHDIRAALEMQLRPDLGLPKSFNERLASVHRAREKMADRIESGAMFRTPEDGKPVGIRESLRDSYDVHAVREASKEFGLGDFVEEADAIHESERHAVDPDYDVTSDLD
jgi:hypothetical protein